MHKIFGIEKSILYSRRNLYLGESNRFLVDPIYIYNKRESGNDRASNDRTKKEKEKKWNRRERRKDSASSPNARSAFDTLGSPLSLRWESRRNRDPPAIISFLFIQHIVSGLRVVRRSIRHRLFLPTTSRPAGRPWFTSAPKYVSQTIVQPIVFRVERRLFHCNFHFYIARGSVTMHLARAHIMRDS